MRKRLVLGNLLATVVALGVAFALAAAGVGQITATVLVAALLVGLTSASAIVVVNDLLRRMGAIEEAALRVTFGEAGVRIGELPAPYDGLAHRLDQVFETLDSANRAGTKPSA